jgi:methionyl-tRNA formyltransferase
MARILFMGTPDFAVPSLAALVRDGYAVVAVVTQPDRPRGRGRKLVASPVKQFAEAHALPVLQPETLRSAEAVARLAALRPDLIVVAAFGQILRPSVLALPPQGCINVHGSLLPRWRGAAPVQAAILAGDQVTGSTIMLMDEGMDTGPILAQEALLIEPAETGGELTARLARQGAGLLSATLPAWLAGRIVPRPQEESLATACRPIRKEEGRIDWTSPASSIGRMVRAYHPWPAASTTWKGALLKVLAASVAEPLQPAVVEPGTVVERQDQVLVATGEGMLELREVQLAGRGAMAAADFARGQRDFVGSVLGSEA